MKPALTFLSCLMIMSISWAQPIAGKWYGKITQIEGGYSENYDFELNLTQGRKISGESYAYIPKTLSVKIGIRGFIDRDTIRLSESLYDIRERRVPPNWEACIKNLNLKYYKQGNDEFLKGVWNGISMEDGSDCLPGEIILSRSKAALNRLNTGSTIPEVLDSISRIIPEFTPTFLGTTIKNVKQIEVRNRNIQLQISDYEKVDGDIVSIYLNRALLASKQEISKKKIRLSVELNTSLSLNEIILFAENLGSIPPNTSRLTIIDGQTIHNLIIESDKQRTAAIYLKYIP